MARKSAQPQVKRRTSYHHGNLREALLEAAGRRIAESQDFDFRLRDLAHDCGVQLAACYRHFESKSDVLVELARRGFVDLEAALAQVADEEAGERALARLGTAYVAFAIANPVAYLAMFHPSLVRRGAHAALDAAASATFQRLRSTVSRALGPEAPARTVERVAFQAWAGVHGYASLLAFRDREEPAPPYEQAAGKKAIAAYTEMLARGVLQSTSST